MEIALYIRKEYFRGVTLTDKSAHILEFHYEGEHVDVFENGGLVFRFRYVLETKFKANIVEFYIPDMTKDMEASVCARFWISSVRSR